MLLLKPKIKHLAYLFCFYDMCIVMCIFVFYIYIFFYNTDKIMTKMLSSPTLVLPFFFTFYYLARHYFLNMEISLAVL